jgi:hypothetical protein
MEGFCHVEKKRTYQSLLAQVPSHPFNVAGQLKSRAVFGSESKLLITQ